ncbi:hypothetical protein EZ428_06835 [Pedobacter frigiditerrae]|uniref:Uncharacterized protein n=1 Tax=Pedobacter frigiditerrae TaxID=2530452 RepID=A0A4R0N3N6_9SPHI|nr:DUF6498-containing protein [Pedobacter frigiditerrae]TCC94479.1 hypothetical protein EZ428_06835 [Pedobacter frigiditerrae]
MNKAQRNINIIMMLLFSAYAIYSIVYDNANLFFIIYLFWFDELIRNISLLIQVKMHREDPKNIREFTKRKAISNIKTRFFFLFIYSVFIVLVFGLFFHLAQDEKDALVKNVQIFMFHDIAFNVCLMIAIVREVLQIRSTSLNRQEPIPTFGAMSGHLITLHLSIIFGAFLWAFTSGKFINFSFSLGSLNKYAIILPFFMIKFLVDLYAINHNEKDKTLLDTLQNH